MTNKSVIIRPSEHGPSQVDVQVDLCSYYREIVEALPTDGEDKFRLHLDVLVWGSFYIEAALNRTLIMMIEDSVHGILSPGDVASSLERSSFETKVSLILNKFDHDDERKSEIRKGTRELLQLRNRLVHPKEKPEETNLVISEDEQLRPAIDAARRTESALEKEMFAVELHERKATILNIGKWFEGSIFEYYTRQKGA